MEKIETGCRRGLVCGRLLSYLLTFFLTFLSFLSFLTMSNAYSKLSADIESLADAEIKIVESVLMGPDTPELLKGFYTVYRASNMPVLEAYKLALEMSLDVCKQIQCLSKK